MKFLVFSPVPGQSQAGVKYTFFLNWLCPGEEVLVLEILLT
jgi:hypothetical protein